MHSFKKLLDNTLLLFNCVSCSPLFRLNYGLSGQQDVCAPPPCGNCNRETNDPNQTLAIICVHSREELLQICD